MSSRGSRKAEGAGGLTFAAVLFTIAGFFHGIEGLGAIFKKEYFWSSPLRYGRVAYRGCSMLGLAPERLAGA